LADALLKQTEARTRRLSSPARRACLGNEIVSAESLPGWRVPRSDPETYVLCHGLLEGQDRAATHPKGPLPPWSTGYKRPLTRGPRCLGQRGSTTACRSRGRGLLCAAKTGDTIGPADATSIPQSAATAAFLWKVMVARRGPPFYNQTFEMTGDLQGPRASPSPPRNIWRGPLLMRPRRWLVSFFCSVFTAELTPPLPALPLCIRPAAHARLRPWWSMALKCLRGLTGSDGIVKATVPGPTGARAPRDHLRPMAEAAILPCLTWANQGCRAIALLRRPDMLRMNDAALLQNAAEVCWLLTPCLA